MQTVARKRCLTLQNRRRKHHHSAVTGLLTSRFFFCASKPAVTSLQPKEVTLETFFHDTDPVVYFKLMVS
jgi:hypothetical protein